MPKERERSAESLLQLVEPAVVTPVYFSGARAQEAPNGTDIHITLWADLPDQDGKFQPTIVARLIGPADACVRFGLSLQQTLHDALLRLHENGKETERKRG